MTNKNINIQTPLHQRFRSFMPIAIDLETGGFNPKKDALLELAAVFMEMNEQGLLEPTEKFNYHIMPFNGANLDRRALDFTGIHPYNPFRQAVSELDALSDLHQHIKRALLEQKCSKAVMVAHNTFFDQSFYQAAIKRCQLEQQNPFHSFTAFDTATLGGLAFGQTVFSKAVKAAGLPFDEEQAHNAKYDAKQTALLFCHIVNRWQTLGGWS